MWRLIRGLSDTGVTIILTTHYIAEAEQMAERVGVINRGEIILVEDKAELMRKLGKKQLTLELHQSRSRASRDALAPVQSGAGGGWQPARLHLRHAGRAHRHHAAARRRSARRTSASATSPRTRARWRISSCQPGEEGRMNLARGPRDLRVRDVAHGAHVRCRASCRRSSPPRSISSCSGRRSARASPRSRASATAPSSCRGC